MLVTFDQVAEAAGVSRALVHTYLGDRRGLIDAVQVGVVGRLDTWVSHGLARAHTREDRLRAVVTGTFAFVDAEEDAWGVLGSTGGLDHPALHGLRGRWTAELSVDDDAFDLGAQSAVAALLAGVGPWTRRGIDPADVSSHLVRLL